MRHVRQVTDIDCGIAAAAMLSGLAYGAVAARPDLPPEREHGLYVSEMAALLGALTRRQWVVRTVRAGTRLCDLPEMRCAVVIGHDSQDFGHWIVLDGRRVHDPELEAATPMRAYPRRKWRVLRVVSVSGQRPS